MPNKNDRTTLRTWMGVENALYALVDQLDLMHGLVERKFNQIGENNDGEP